MTKFSSAAVAVGAVAAAVLSWAAPASATGADIDGNWNQTTSGVCEQPLPPMPDDASFSVQCEHHSVVEHSVG